MSVVPIDHDWTLTIAGYTFGIQSYPTFRGNPAYSTVYYGFGSFWTYQSPYVIIGMVAIVPLVCIIGTVAWRRRKHERAA